MLSHSVRPGALDVVKGDSIGFWLGKAALGAVVWGATSMQFMGLLRLQVRSGVGGDVWHEANMSNGGVIVGNWTQANFPAGWDDESGEQTNAAVIELQEENAGFKTSEFRPILIRERVA